MAYSSQQGFQDSASPIMEELTYFHDHTFEAVLLISILVMYLITALLKTKLYNTNTIDAQEIEMVWTMMPAIVLITIALPSLRILYVMDEISAPDLTIKAIGHQWFWSYECSDFISSEYSSYMVQTTELEQGHLRLLEVDNRMTSPTNMTTRMLITSEDVLHSWAVPSLGVKADAIPGRLNQSAFLISCPGLYYGQCSEICGANHSYMPIVVEALPIKEFMMHHKHV